jgi:hypothetical protein
MMKKIVMLFVQTIGIYLFFGILAYFIYPETHAPWAITYPACILVCLAFGANLLLPFLHSLVFWIVFIPVFVIGVLEIAEENRISHNSKKTK